MDTSEAETAEWGDQAIGGAATSEREAKLLALLERERARSASERMGRIRAERALKDALCPPSLPADGASKDSMPAHAHDSAWRFQPIGHIETPFDTRNGTPRQPSLVPSAPGRVTLLSHVPTEILEGLERFSHCWLIFVFHCNTNLHQPMGRRGLKGKVKPPRLNGAPMGVLATRTPHRPNPLGLSLCEVAEVVHRTLVLRGVDLVNGSPILDVKPYLPFVEAPVQASAPPWVVAEAESEPLQITAVEMSKAALAELHACWQSLPALRKQLLPSFGQFRQFVEEVLSRDIRALRKRLPGNDSPCSNEGVLEEKASAGAELLHVSLLDIDVNYQVIERCVFLRGAVAAPALS